ARGGIGIYYPSTGRWEFVFLKWRDGRVKFTQMVDLRHLSNGAWMVALRAPQAILTSKDLKNWHPLHIEGLNEGFDHHAKIDEGGNVIACSTGRSLLVLQIDELENVLDGEPVMSSYKAYIDRLKGLGFVLKRSFIS
ncbi:MAG: hypothetical protein N3H31_06415, partial [Candidatus Nezhaarchaeota archaeon]|nr:hypothetical protein [Candidatus Nezhaarchaeota archaeon]